MSVPRVRTVGAVSKRMKESPATIDVRYIYHDASEYRDRGWSTIPLVGKKAAIRWKEFTRRLPTLHELFTWFGDGNPKRHNIGIVTGKISALVGVDCDSRGEAVWWWEQFAKTPLLVKTGKGIHFYYQHKPGTVVRNRAGLFGRKIDLRGENGYLVAPPSIHRRFPQARFD